MRHSLVHGEPVTIPLPNTIADALQTTRPAERTFNIVRALAEGVLTVSDLELRQAMAFLASRMKLVVEPGGGRRLRRPPPWQGAGRGGRESASSSPEGTSIPSALAR